MKFSHYETTEKGISLRGHSRLLNFFLRVWSKRIIKKLIKKGTFPKDSKITVETFAKFNVKVEGKDAIDNDKHTT